MLYQQAGVNPLAGCLPTLATLPVFIGLYRALTNAASDGLLTEGFFWIPSLGGPSTMADNTSGRGLGWLFPLIDGAPPIGWHDAAAYLVLPVLLVVSQFASQKIMQPNQSTDPSQASANAILKFLPFMVGWFSLNVPSGLTLYWIVNNILTTAQTVYLRGAVASAAAGGAGGAGGAATLGGGAPAAPERNMADDMRTMAGGKRLPPNPPRVSDASRAVVDVEVVAGGSSSGGSGSSVEASRPGARFAQLKAAEAAKQAGKGGQRQKRQAQGSAPNVNWAEGSGSSGGEDDKGNSA
jgi:YidC/Oxa1 family membrane protein insertase